VSQLPSGSDVGLRSYLFEMTDSSNIGEARRFAAQITAELDFSEQRASAVAIIVNELGTNLSRHAKKGRIILQATEANGVKAIQILAIDSGPGIDHIEGSMLDGVSTGSTPGTGLGAIKRQADEFDIYTASSGTVLYAAVRATDDEPTVERPCFAVGAICIPVAPETVSGDAWFQIRNGENIVMMIADGLGHGPLAHKASSTAVSTFRSMDPSLPLDVMMKRLHEVLRSTRGAALSLCRWIPHENVLEHLGIGNVRTALLDFAKDRTFINVAGTVGLQFRAAIPQRNPWNGNGLVAMHSDGVQSRWTSASMAAVKDHHPAIAAGLIFRDYTRGKADSDPEIVTRS
jgi:anti-sigma regulatory factor (Ser/Thr protein kinase)